MKDLNKAMVIGNLTRDPEIRSIPSGQAVASFTVATNRRWKSQEGEMKDSAEFHDIVAWGKLAEIAEKILKKGRRTYVEGRLQTRSWEGQDGVKRNKTEIIASDIIVLDKKPEEADLDIQDDVSTVDISGEKEVPGAMKDSKEKEEKENNKEKSDNTDEEVDLDDIPF